MGIFKWFFGIIGAIILVYVLIVMVRTVITSGFSTVKTVSTSTTTDAISSTTIKAVNTVTTFSLTEWLRNFQPFKFSPLYIGYDAQNANTGFFTKNQNRQTQEDLYNQNFNDAPNFHPTDWAPVESFDSRWNSAQNQNSNLISQIQNPNQNTIPSSSKYIKVNLDNNFPVKNFQAINGLAYVKVFSNRYFPVYVLDQNGNIIGSGSALPNGDINSAGFVPFRVVLEFNNQGNSSGFLMFKNENVDQVGFKAVTVVPVIFRNEYYGAPVTNYGNQMPPLLYNTPRTYTNF